MTTPPSLPPPPPPTPPPATPRPCVTGFGESFVCFAKKYHKRKNTTTKNVDCLAFVLLIAWVITLNVSRIRDFKIWWELINTVLYYLLLPHWYTSYTHQNTISKIYSNTRFQNYFYTWCHNWNNKKYQMGFTIHVKKQKINPFPWFKNVKILNFGLLRFR